MSTWVGPMPPELDDFGLLRVDDAWVALSPIQERLMRRFLAEAGAPVARAELAQEIGITSGSRSRTIDSHILRLRTRIQPLGLTIHTIRGRGFLLASPQRRTTWPIS
ncbi:MAG TPA: winged helix-turn-helix domain-containing protein [Acidimicrobiales bacterium]|nr:winged helix-turn-helix domain-containing protein [Acidimicrobiales bacterium]